MSNFGKKDLKNGDVILRYDGSVQIVCLTTGTLIDTDGFDELSAIKEDLTSYDGTEFDIIQVRRPTKPSECSFNAFDREKGELVYSFVAGVNLNADLSVKMTIKQIKEALGITNLSIVDYE